MTGFLEESMCIDAVFVGLNSLVEWFLPVLCSFCKRLEVPSATFERQTEECLSEYCGQAGYHARRHMVLGLLVIQAGVDSIDNGMTGSFSIDSSFVLAVLRGSEPREAPPS